MKTVKIATKDIGDVRIIYIHGHLDASTSPEAEKIILEQLDKGYYKIIINLENTVYMSSSGLRVMLKTAKTLKNTGTLRISNLTNIVEEIFQISGFKTILNVNSTEQEALANI